MKKIFTRLILGCCLMLPLLATAQQQWEEIDFLNPATSVVEHIQFIDDLTGFVKGKVYSGGVYGLYKTTDGGETFTESGTPPFISGRTWQACYFHNEQDGIAVYRRTTGGYYTISYTNDGGQNWTQVPGYVENLDYSQVMFLGGQSGTGPFTFPMQFTDANFGYSWGRVLSDSENATINTLWTTNDGGHTWQEKTLPNKTTLAHRVTFVNQNEGYVVVFNEGIYKTTDGGDNWNVVYGVNVNGIYGISSKGNTVIACLKEVNTDMTSTIKLLKSTNGGQNWTDITHQAILDANGLSAVSISFHDEQNILIGIATSNSNAKDILRTTDGGANWTEDIVDLPGNTTLGGIKTMNYAGSNVQYAKLGNIHARILRTGSPGSVGITDNYLNDLIKMYPNPANDFVTISNVPIGSKVMVTDINGKLVYSSETNNEQTTISTTNFVNGVYIIQIQNNSAVANKKLVVNR